MEKEPIEGAEDKINIYLYICVYIGRHTKEIKGRT